MSLIEGLEIAAWVALGVTLGVCGGAALLVTAILVAL